MQINGIGGKETDNFIKSSYGKERTKAADGTEEKSMQVKNGSINAAGLNLCQDSIEDKKKKAMEDAMDLIKKQYETDSQIDDFLDEVREDTKANKQAAQEALKEFNAIKEEKEKLKEQYSDESDPEYQAALKDYNEMENYWKKEIDTAHKAISADAKAVRNIKQEILKQHGMDDAKRAADEMLEAAGKEIIGMLMDEAKDKVDKELEEVVDKAEEVKEAKEEKEEALEEAQAEREKMLEDEEEELQKRKKVRVSQKDINGIDYAELMRSQQKIAEGVEEILEEQKLLAEEIKGIVIDTSL